METRLVTVSINSKKSKRDKNEVYDQFQTSERSLANDDDERILHYQIDRLSGRPNPLRIDKI